MNIILGLFQDEKTRRDSLTAAKLKETKVNMLGEMRRFSNAVQADKDQLQEQVDFINTTKFILLFGWEASS